MARINIKVVPNSSRDEVVGWLGDALKVKVMAPPEKERANEAVIALLAARPPLTRRLARARGFHAWSKADCSSETASATISDCPARA